MSIVMRWEMSLLITHLISSHLVIFFKCIFLRRFQVYALRHDKPTYFRCPMNTVYRYDYGRIATSV